VSPRNAANPSPAPAPANPKPRKPATAPDRASLAERDRFADLHRTQSASLNATAQSWRNGLAAFITLVTTGLVIKGQDSAAALPTTWRLAVTLLLGGGLALTVTGLWLTLAAEAGSDMRLRSLPDIRREYGSLAGYELHVVDNGAKALARGRYAVALALVLLLAGIITTWWAPAAPADPPAYLNVTAPGGPWCGRLLSADGGQLRLSVTGQAAVVVVPLSRVANLAVVPTCS
jgi:hypothetical protein